MIPEPSEAPPEEEGPFPVRVYGPESRLRKPGLFARELVEDLIACRHLAWRLFLRDLRAQYRQTLLGYLWAFLPPLATTGLWVLLQRARVVNIEAPTEVPYAIYVLTGTLLWQVFVDAIVMPLDRMQAGKAMLARINFPREALLVAGALEVGFNLLLRALLLVVVFVAFGVSVHSTLALVPLGLLALFTLGGAIGLILAPLGLLYGDVRRGLPMINRFWFYLTPIIYQPPQTGLARYVDIVNPVAPLLSTTRDWLLSGTPPSVVPFAVVGGLSLLLLLAGLVLLRIAMPFLIERMST